jgi:excisionase family DNA binding protein
MSETATPSQSDRWALSVDETAAILGISRAHAYRMVRSGVLPSIRLGQRLIVPIESLRAILADETG